MAVHYPSTKNIMLLAFSLLVIGGTFFIVENHTSKKTKVVYQALTTSTSTSSGNRTIQIDSENIDLGDWEKVLRENSIAIANTSSGTSTKKGTATSTKLTITDQFGRDLFAQYMNLKQSGLSSDTQSRNEVIDQLLSSSQYVALPTTYTLKQLKIRADASPESIRRYGNEAGALMKKNSIESRNETVILKESLQKSDPAILKELDPLITAYRAVVKGLLLIEVPSGMTTLHLELVNTMSALLFTTESFAKAFVDPVVSLQALAKYPQTSQSITNALLSMKNYFKATGITFEAQEAGQYFTGPSL